MILYVHEEQVDRDDFDKIGENSVSSRGVRMKN